MLINRKRNRQILKEEQRRQQRALAEFGLGQPKINWVMIERVSLLILALVLIAIYVLAKGGG